jgi:thiamine pyrophosphate-dependent acetolactate synthase large subunit-like protein
MLIDGDGSLYQHIQELETVRRHGIKLLICIINDGGYGAETHKFGPMASIRCTRPTAGAILPR